MITKKLFKLVKTGIGIFTLAFFIFNFTISVDINSEEKPVSFTFSTQIASVQAAGGGCTASATCASGDPVSCKGKKQCTGATNAGVVCDGVTTTCSSNQE